MSLLAYLPLIREIVALGQAIADNVRDRRRARRKPAKPCPPPAATRARPIPKQNPKPDGKR